MRAFVFHFAFLDRATGAGPRRSPGARGQREAEPALGEVRLQLPLAGPR